MRCHQAAQEHGNTKSRMHRKPTILLCDSYIDSTFPSRLSLFEIQYHRALRLLTQPFLPRHRNRSCRRKNRPIPTHQRPIPACRLSLHRIPTNQNRSRRDLRARQYCAPPKQGRSRKRPSRLQRIRKYRWPSVRAKTGLARLHYDRADIDPAPVDYKAKFESPGIGNLNCPW